MGRVSIIWFRLTRVFLVIFALLVSQMMALTFYIQPADAAGEVFRTTTYEFQPGEFTGGTYTLTLNNDLETDYFTMISGATNATGTRGQDDDRVRVTQDPHGNFASNSASNQIELTRIGTDNDWIGALTIVECVFMCSTFGFTLSEVLETTLPLGAGNAAQTVTDTLSSAYTANTVPFGARFGGGMTTTATDANSYSTTVGVKISKVSGNQIQFDRFGAENRAPGAATVTTYMTEWGSEWSVQDVNVTGTNAGQGLNSTAHYNTAAISSVNRDNTWVWGAGFASDDGLGDGALGQAVTLGNGVAVNATETLVAVGAEGGQIAPGRDFQVYVLELSDLSVEHDFKTLGDVGASSGYQELTRTVQAPLFTESHDNVSTDVQTTEGYRVPLFYNTSSGVGQAYSRTGAWGLRHTDNTTLSYWRAYSGQNVTGWLQSIDFGNVRVTNTETKQVAYRWRDDSTDVNLDGGWLAAEDSAITPISKNDTTRLRMKVTNFGTIAEPAARTYELQYAQKTLGQCSSVGGWTGVSDVAGDDFRLEETIHIDPDGEITTAQLLSNVEGYTYVNGEGRESADTTSPIGPISADAYTELEYSLQADDNAVNGQTYCFRLYDTTADSVLDEYITYPEITIESTTLSSSGLGEAGTFASAVDGGWSTVNFIGTYTTPVVVGTTNSQNGENALVFEARNVTATSAEMRVCESEGSTVNGCDTHASETVGYMVIDAVVAAVTEGIEAGTFTANGNSDANSVNVTYAGTYGATPYVYANVNTVNSTEFPIEVVVRNTLTTGFTGGICEHLLGSDNDCDGTHGNETVGWVAINPNDVPFQEQHYIGEENISNSVWTGVTFSPAFAATPAVIVSSQTDNGGEDVEIDEARLVSASGADVRFCEIDTFDVCNSHAADDVAWFAIEQGEFMQNIDLDQDGYRIYENIDALTPTNALANENTEAADVAIGEVVRIRTGLQSGTVNLPLDTAALRLQFATGTDCTVAAGWDDVGGVGSGAIWRGFNNPTAAEEATLPSSLLDGGTNIVQTYEEENDTALNPNTIAAGQRGEWDFAVENNGATPFTSYCFRVVTDTGQEINYTRYPRVITASLLPNLPPFFPVALDQERTLGTVIATGQVIADGTVVFTGVVSDQNPADIVELCVEVQEVGTAFTDAETLCGPSETFTGPPVNTEVTISGFTHGSDYHWQAMTRDAAGFESAWVSYGGNLETEADFSIDMVDPVGSVFDGTTTGVDIEYNDGSLDTLSANWAIADADSGLADFEFSIGTSPDGSDIFTWTSVGTDSDRTETGLTLLTSIPYYINIRATDNAGNQVTISSDGQYVAPTLTFSTGSVGVEFSNLNAANSFTDTKTTTLTTSTNAREGYAVRAYTTGPLENILLDTIPDFSGGSYAAPDVWNAGEYGYGYTSNDTLIQGADIFNSAVCPGGGSGGPCFAPFTQTGPGDIVADSPGLGPGNSIDNEQFIITHRVSADPSQAYGRYITTIVFQATAVY